jgi:hypothetical protein
MRAKSFLVLVLTLWAAAHVISFYWELTSWLKVPRCRGNCYVVSELVYVLLGEALLSWLLVYLLPLFADLGLGLMAHSWRQFFLFVVLAVLAVQVEFLLVDWLGGRFPGLMRDYYGWAREIFFRFALPALFVTVGASAGAVKRKYLFVSRSQHA